ncbi:MAG: DUF58 domain-containing protein, partial [Verrucomicrobia bacterium]|nr:DUF58 domain-containing protein [Verrucomicrobiota bacterium]
MLRPRTLPHDPVDSRQFEVAVRRLANSLDFGQRDSVFHGAGLEYVQSRPYVAGDAVKFIDWKISARLGKLYVKEFKETKQIPLYLLLDTSASMCVSSQPLSKYAWAVRVATGIGLAAQSSVTPVGLLGCGARELHIRPTLSRNIVMEWAHQLRQHDFTEVTSLSARARELAPSLAKRTTVIVLSDLHDPDAIAALQVLSQRNDCIVLHFEDPAEQGLRGSGIIRGVEAESGRGFVGFGGRRQVDSSGWKAELSRFGIDYLPLRTDEPILGKAHADITQARLRWQRVGGKEDLIPLGSGTVHLEATAAGLNGELRISAGEAGRADGSLRTGALGARWREAPLTAALRIDSNALAFVHLYVPEIDRAAGQLRADLEFGGSLGAPLVNGSIRVENGELDLYQVNLALRGVNAEARMLDNGFKFAATGSAGAGRLSAAGELVWRNRLPYGQLRITGNDLKLVDVPEARIHATP